MGNTRNEDLTQILKRPFVFNVFLQFFVLYLQVGQGFVERVGHGVDLIRQFGYFQYLCRWQFFAEVEFAHFVGDTHHVLNGFCHA